MQIIGRETSLCSTVVFVHTAYNYTTCNTIIRFVPLTLLKLTNKTITIDAMAVNFEETANEIKLRMTTICCQALIWVIFQVSEQLRLLC